MYTSVETLCHSSHFWFTPIYAFIILQFVPLMLLVFDNYNIVTPLRTALFQTQVVILMVVTILTLFYDYGVIAIVSYSVSDAIDLVVMNRPPPFQCAKESSLFYYFGPICFHHLVVMIIFIMYDIGILPCDMGKVVCMVQASRIAFRTMLIVLYYLNKNWERMYISVFCFLASTISEIAFIGSLWSLLGPFAMIQVIFVIIDSDLAFALWRQYKKIVDTQKAMDRTITQDNDDLEHTESDNFHDDAVIAKV